MVARIRAILRRTAATLVTTDEFTVGDIELSGSHRSVHKHGQQLDLTSTEFNILSLLLKTPGQMLTKEQLTEQAMARKLERYDRAIDMHVSNLRKKLGDHPDGSPRIQTVRGMGYLYTVPTVPQAQN